MSFWREAKEIFREEVSLAELTDPSRAGDKLVRFLLLVRETWRSIQRHRSLTLASSLSYKTLVGMVPIMAIALAAVAMLPQNVFDEGSASSSFTPTESFIQVIKSRLDFPGRDQLVDSIQQFADNARTILGIGFLFLFAAAFSLLGSIENAFNTIWQVREKRSFLSKWTSFLATLILVPILMSLSVYVTSRLAVFTEQVAERIPISLITETEKADDTSKAGEKANEEKSGAKEDHTAQAENDKDKDADKTLTTVEDTPQPATPTATKNNYSFFTKSVMVLAGLFMTCLAMSILFYVIPNTPVKLKVALAGGIFSGILFEGTIYLFRYYAGYLSVNYTKVYGPLLAIPFFLLLTWLIWAVVLIGSELAFTLQNFSDLTARAELEKRGISSRIYLAVRIVVAASDAFHRGDSPRKLVDQVASQCRMPPYAVREIISILVDGGILRKVVPGEDAYLPAKDICRLTVSEVVHTVASDRLDVPEIPDDAVQRYLAKEFDKAENGTESVLGEITFSDIANICEKERREQEKVSAVPMIEPDTVIVDDED